MFATRAIGRRTDFHPLPEATDERLARITARFFRPVHCLPWAEGTQRVDDTGLQLDDRPTALWVCQSAPVWCLIACGEDARRTATRRVDLLASRDDVEVGECSPATGGLVARGHDGPGGSTDPLQRLARGGLPPTFDEDRLGLDARRERRVPVRRSVERGERAGGLRAVGTPDRIDWFETGSGAEPPPGGTGPRIVTSETVYGVANPPNSASVAGALPMATTPEVWKGLELPWGICTV